MVRVSMNREWVSNNKYYGIQDLVKRLIYVAATEEVCVCGGGHIAFGADPVGFGVRLDSCLHSMTWTNTWILIKLARTHYWEWESSD